MSFRPSKDISTQLFGKRSHRFVYSCCPVVRSIAQLLGHSFASKLLIIHTDDLGMSHSVNAATFAAFEAVAVSSASIMVPCAWFPEAAQWAAEHPQYDI